jgi:hypothetical protein
LPSTPSLDARHLTEACTALLFIANQLLKRIQGSTTSSDLQHSIPIAFDQLDPSAYDFDLEFSASDDVEGSNGESSANSSPSTWHNEADTLLLDFGDWIDSGLDASWQSDGGDGSHCSVGSSQDPVQYSFDMGVWSAMDNDKWPCFPG